METSLRSLTRVDGLIGFISQLRSTRPDLSESSLTEIQKFIELSGCKRIRFARMSDRAMGISKTNECVINQDLIKLPLQYLVYILLHEIVHQYQYKKYGKDYMLDVYLDELCLEQAVQTLLHAERVADRLSISRTTRMIGKNMIVPRYLNIKDTTQLKKHIVEIRKAVSTLNLKSIEEINEYIHGSVNFVRNT